MGEGGGGESGEKRGEEKVQVDEREGGSRGPDRESIYAYWGILQESHANCYIYSLSKVKRQQSSLCSVPDQTC